MGLQQRRMRAGEGGSLTYRSHYQFMHEEGVMGPGIGHLDPMPDSDKNSRPGLAARTAQDGVSRLPVSPILVNRPLNT